MNIAIWIVLALVCFVMPATALTQGGNRYPQRKKLAEHATHVGLPLPDAMVKVVSERIRRRQRGMMLGGITGIVLATLSYIVFFNNNDGAAPALVIFLCGAGTALGGAWAIAVHRPLPRTDRPTVARTRSVDLSDYLTRGERFGFWMVPAMLTVGTICGLVLLQQLPEVTGMNAPVVGVSIAIGALLTWAIAWFSLRNVLAAPARSASELELAWDDAERADGLRQVANLTVAVGCLSLAFWLILIAEVMMVDGFYREHEAVAWTIASISVALFGLTAAVLAWGPVTAWLTGRRKGYEQRQLWPSGVTS